MAKLFLLRHLKSQWNEENRFTGWTDVPLSEEGVEGAKDRAEKFKGERIDIVYTSPLVRNRETVRLVLENLGQKNLPVIADEALNERNYGILTGFNKDEMKKKYGEERIRIWRRSYDVAPPKGESLEDVCNRTTPFFRKYAEKDLKDGKNVLIVASHNSLRAIMKYIEKIPDEKIIDAEIPFGGLIEYDFDERGNLINKKEL
jgi:2,3-bisphosphoglycerate-dependent phosphoglycerate mutase